MHARIISSSNEMWHTIFEVLFLTYMYITLQTKLLALEYQEIVKKQVTIKWLILL